MGQKDKLRRLNYLCAIHVINRSTEPFSIEKKLQMFDVKEQPKGVSKKHIEYIKGYVELLKLFQELGFSDQEAFDYWFKLNTEHWRRSAKYNQKPIPVRKDNPNTYGEKFVGYGTRRQPRKCRKTAWKRFKKLFPEHKIV